MEPIVPDTEVSCSSSAKLMTLHSTSEQVVPWLYEAPGLLVVRRP